MSIVNAVPLLEAAGGDGYTISRSVRLRSSASAYLNRTPASSGNLTTWTWSGWVKRGKLGANQKILGTSYTSTSEFYLRFNSSDCLEYGSYTSGGAANNFNVITTQVFRDPSAWYHLTLVWDTAQATAANRLKMYVNGLQITTFSTATYPTQNYSGIWNNSGWTHCIGADPTGMYFDGYITETYFVDGQALTPSSFGETDTITGVWKPKRYTGTYGTNGFYLNFADNSNNTAATIGKDSSGNGNNWTPNNISVTAGATYDSMLDTPTPYADGGNGRGNYCALNPLDKDSGNTVADGNLKVTTSTTGQGFQRASIFVNSGKWYWEVTVTSATGNSSIGIAGPNTQADTSNFIGATADSYGYVATNGNKYNNGSSAAYGATYTTGNVIGVALDMDAGTLTFYKNNASQGTAYSSLSGYFAPALSDVSNSSSSVFTVNFGQQPFLYTPPTGFVALNTQNLPDATIKKGSAYFDVSTWTGDSATPKAVVTGLGFQPDLIWAKTRSTTYDHMLFDSVRGAGSTKDLSSNTTGAEGTTGATYGYVSSIDSAGFTVTKGSGATNILNQSGQTFAAWQWKAGGTAASNTAGSIASSVSAGVSQGFSVVQFTATGSNATVGHGLGVAPAMVIVKDAASVGNWAVYHKSLTSAAYYLYMNTTAAQANVAAIWNNTAPTSTVFSVGTWHTADRQIAYCFAEVAGYSKFGSYTGNGSTDGPFVYCGFRPKFVMIKNASAGTGTDNWIIKDTSRNPSNVADADLYPNLSNAEDTVSTVYVDLLSNGFKVRGTYTGTNGSGNTLIYAAFAENPTKYALAR